MNYRLYTPDFPETGGQNHPQMRGLYINVINYWGLSHQFPAAHHSIFLQQSFVFALSFATNDFATGWREGLSHQTDPFPLKLPVIHNCCTAASEPPE